jgi:chemotaxis protein CheZ
MNVMISAGFDASLDARLAALDAQRGGSVPVAELGAVLSSLMKGVEGDVDAGVLRLHGELVELVDYIRRAKQEIAAIKPSEIDGEKITNATDELDAVVKATEEATGTILDVAENLMAMADTMAPDAGERIVELATRIFEASNFQDITGQRISKVVSTLRYIEQRVSELAGAAGNTADVPARSAETARPEPAERSLLNGPQLPENANSQDDIDALFASL